MTIRFYPSRLPGELETHEHGVTSIRTGWQMLKVTRIGMYRR
jgi:hypothetical protein